MHAMRWRQFMLHAGWNNAYLITTRHEYARMYNDNSVLENRHVSLLYTLLAAEPHADVLAGACSGRQAHAPCHHPDLHMTGVVYAAQSACC